MSVISRWMESLSLGSSRATSVSADVLECPVCLEFCMENAFECRNGHLVCGQCHADGNIQICPTCRNGDLRESYLLREYLQRATFCCKNKEFGCDAVLKVHLLAGHELQCDHQKGVCKTCQQHVMEQNMKKHILEQHANRVFQGSGRISKRLTGPAKEEYYFVYHSKMIVVTIDCVDGDGDHIYMWAKAFGDDIIPRRLRVKAVFEKGVQNIEWTSRILEKRQKPDSFTRYSSSEEAMKPFIDMGCLTVFVGFQTVKLTRLDAGCAHYSRNCKLVCPDLECNQIVSCRVCHDEKIKTHTFDRFNVMEIICCLCGLKQSPKRECSECKKPFAQYYCSKCHFYDNSGDDIFHCDKCGICRRRLRKGMNYFHCDLCDICNPESSRATHKCVKQAAKQCCCICKKDLHQSRAPIVSMRCGHYVHDACPSSLGMNPNIQNCLECSC